MVNETPSPDTQQNDGSGRPLRYEDFLDPNPFVRSWMLPHLPNNQRLRDIVIMVIGCAVSCAIGSFIWLLTSNETLTLIVILGGAALFQSDMWNRIISANFRYGKAKRRLRNKISN